MSNLELLCREAKNASRSLAQATTEEKNVALFHIAEQIWSGRGEILAANQADVESARRSGLDAALLDRLMLNELRLTAIVADLHQVAGLPDPVGEVFDQRMLPNQMRLRRQRVPLGVLAVIYEARPNVTVDVAGLTLKSGNCAILRGGSETIRTNQALTTAIRKGLAESSLPETAIQMIASPDRALVLELLQMDRYVDMVIPRGGASLHQFCRQNSRIPVITGGMGICHLFVDESADQARSIEVIRNAKVQRPSVCNALDTALVHSAIAAGFLPRLVEHLSPDGVTFRADERALAALGENPHPGVKPAGPQDFDTEWLSLVLGLKVVDSLNEAVEVISAHSTGHSDGILTNNPENAQRFCTLVDSAAVYVNASTRFTDGAQFGLGAEIAISTQRLHARGPMGLAELTTYKWIVEGNYSIRPE